MLIEKDYNSLLLCYIRGDENRDVRLILCCAKGEADGLEPKVVEAFENFLFETSC